MSEAEQEQQPPIISTPIFIAIDGSLPGGKWLTYPLLVQIENDDGEVVVSEPQFHIHAAASTVPEAITAFKRILTGELELLSSHEAKLGPLLLAQLDYLRTIIGTA